VTFWSAARIAAFPFSDAIASAKKENAKAAILAALQNTCRNK